MSERAALARLLADAYEEIDRLRAELDRANADERGGILVVARLQDELRQANLLIAELRQQRAAPPEA